MDSSFSEYLLLFFFYFFKPQTHAYSDTAHISQNKSKSCAVHSHASWKVSCEVLPFCSVTVSNHSDGFLGKLFFSIKGMAGVSQSIKPKPGSQNQEASRTALTRGADAQAWGPWKEPCIWVWTMAHSEEFQDVQCSLLTILAESVLSFQITEASWICSVCLEEP